jgi:hypothetical protein
MGLLNYTTKIDPDKTAQEIARILSMHGASAVMTEYDPVDNFVTALSFKIKLNDQQMSFRLPTDWRPVYEVMTKDKQWRSSYNSDYKRKMESEWKLQAVRTSWRIVKDWTEAQMALVETQMVTTAQVFLPYAVMRDGRTLAETVAQDPKFLLGSGDDH